MPGMKVTVDAAMRARDVSRPHPEHDADAEAAIASMPALRGTPGTRVAPLPSPPVRAPERPRTAATGQPPLPRHRPGPPVPAPASQPPPSPEPAVAPGTAPAPQPTTALNGDSVQPSEQRQPGTGRPQTPPAGRPEADRRGTPGSARPGRRKRVRRRRSQ
jgi:DNA polymerase-3 subunit gamma/tau